MKINKMDSDQYLFKKLLAHKKLPYFDVQSTFYNLIHVLLVDLLIV